MPLSAGESLGPYELQGSIGAGGMGEVYRAFDPRLNRHVALKVVPDDLTADPRRRERFRREAHAIAALTHPHIVTVHSAEDLDGHLVLVMELIEGKTLAQLLSSGGMPLSRLVKYGVQIADALGAAHDRGIIHRDLKPRNVMVTADGRVKVLDFGLAKLRDPSEGTASRHETASLFELTGEGRIVGTAAYMSPEQAEGRPLDHRTDLFSLGILLYEMATGQRPFQGESVVSVLSSILRDAPRPMAELNPRLPREFVRIVRRCLAKDPDERYQSAKDLRLDLDDLRQDLSSSDQATAERAPEPGGHRSWRWLVAGGVGVLAAAGAVAGYLLWGPAPAGSGVAVRGALRLTSEPGAESSPALSPDGQWVVYGRANGRFTDLFLQAVGGDRALNLTADSQAANGEPAFSADGSRIAFRSSRAGGGLFVMGRTGELVRQVTDTGYAPVWSPDGTRLAYSSDPTYAVPYAYPGGSTVWTVDIASGRRTRLSDLDGTQPAWSPNDRRIAFWGVDPVTQHRDIWTVSVAGGPAERVTNDHFTDAEPVWSSDGRYLYFSSSRGGTMNVWRVPIDETSGAVRGPLEPVTVPAENAVRPTLSRDGRRVAYVASSWGSNVYAVPFDPEAPAPGGSPRWLFGGPHRWGQLRASPDGQRLAAIRTSQQQDLVVAAADGSGPQRLTDDAVGVRCPYWSPDARTIVLLSTRRGDKDLIFIEPAGGRTRRVSDLPSTGLVGCPAWSPDGTRLSVVQGPRDPAVLLFDPRQPPTAQTIDRLPPHPGGPFYPRAWSPDGTRLSGTVGERLVLFDLRTRRYADVPGETRLVSATPIDWLPDGRRLLAIASEGDRLLVVDTVTGATQVAYSTAPDVVRSFSLSIPRREIYVSRGAEETDVWIATIQSQ